MPQIGRRVRGVVNPVSTAASRWWCHSALRHTLTGHGPTTRQRQLIRPAMTQTARRAPSAAQMQGRAAAVDQLLDRGDYQPRKTQQR